MIWLVSAALANGLFSAKDQDDDGIPDKHDLCVHKKEVYNDFEDDDGCPDSLSAIEIAVYLKGSYARKAPISALIGEETLKSTGTLIARDLPPGTRVRALSQVGCYDGQVDLTLGPKPRRIRLNLVPRTKTVRFVVKDPETGVPGRARVRWDGTSSCGPDGPMRMHGEREIEVGIGEHTIGLGRAGRKTFTFTVGPDTQEVVIPAQSFDRDADDGSALEPVVYFGSNSAVIDEDARLAVGELFVWLQANPEARVTLVGHTDERASDTYNEGLGERRAQAVHDALVSSGIPADRLEVRSAGESEPAEEGWTEQAYAQNRRVTAEVVRTR